MNKWILILLLVCAGALGLWKFDPLNLFGQKQQAMLLEYVPADTLFYMGGKTDKALTDFVANYPLLASSPSQSVAMNTLKEDLFGSDAASAKLVKYLIEDFSKTSGNTYGDLADYFGTGGEGEYAFYFHGAIPVAHFTLNDVEKFNSVVVSASKEAGLSFKEDRIGEADVKRWSLHEEGDISLDFVIATTKNSAVLTLASSDDDENILAQRVGQNPLQASLASSGEIKKLRADYGYSEHLIFYFNFEHLLKGMYEGENTSLGKDLARYLPGDVKSQLDQSITEECKQDYLGLVGQFPRMVGGYTDLKISGDQLISDFQFLFELKNKLVTDELKKLQGHLPKHTLVSNDKLFGFAMAFDIDQMTPVATALWNAFINADFKCENLVAAQNKAREQNPAMIGMVTGMAHGIKGLGVSVFDFKWDANTKQPSEINALISVAAETPQSVVSLMQMAPMLAGTSVAVDGTPTKLTLPMLPPSIELFAAVKGKHVVVYSGEKGKHGADAMTSEGLVASGLYGGSVNYRKILELAENFDVSNGPMKQAKACIDYYEFLHIMDSMRMDISMTFKSIDEGLEIRAGGTMDKPKAQDYSIDVTGKWKVEYLDEECSWIDSGTETISSDATGQFSEYDSDLGCEVYQVAYNWEKQGGKITMTGSGQERFRDTCEEEWQSEEATTYTCHLINIAGSDSFQCIFDPGTPDVSLHRFTRQ